MLRHARQGVVMGAWLAATLAPVPAAAAHAALDAPKATAAATANGPTPAAQEASPPTTDCAFGLIVWCLVDSERHRGGPTSPLRLEAFGGYKFNNLYYSDEIRGCDEAGCELVFTGPAFGLDAYYNVTGDPRSDDYTALGIAASYIPIVSEMRNNSGGFRGELGTVRAGDGTLGYVPIRLSLRRSHFLYLIKSKYMISSFGVGVALPVSSGAGATFTGADSPKITLGGKLGAELPVADMLKVGVATNWSVIWYGSSFTEASFTSAYGLNLTYLL